MLFKFKEKKIYTYCCNQFTKDKIYKTVEFKYDNKKETYKVYQNLPILATQNIKDKGIFNTMVFLYMEINGNKWRYF